MMYAAPLHTLCRGACYGVIACQAIICCWENIYFRQSLWFIHTIFKKCDIIRLYRDFTLEC